MQVNFFGIELLETEPKFEWEGKIYRVVFTSSVKHCLRVLLKIIPQARMGSESIAHEGERNNCFSKIQLVGQKISRQNNFS